MNEPLKEICILYRNTSIEGVGKSDRLKREPEVNRGRCPSTCKPDIILISVGRRKQCNPLCDGPSGHVAGLGEVLSGSVREAKCGIPVHWTNRLVEISASRLITAWQTLGTSGRADHSVCLPAELMRLWRTGSSSFYAVRLINFQPLQQ